MAEVVFHPETLREYRAAIAWYRRRSLPSARRFVTEVDLVVMQLAAHPQRYAWYDKEFHEAVIHRFPYSMIYRIEPNEDVFVMALVHASREPGYWRGRA
jgi:plasmid stabilization system protein ParE